MPSLPFSFSFPAFELDDGATTCSECASGWELRRESAASMPCEARAAALGPERRDGIGRSKEIERVEF